MHRFRNVGSLLHTACCNIICNLLSFETSFEMVRFKDMLCRAPYNAIETIVCVLKSDPDVNVFPSAFNALTYLVHGSVERKVSAIEMGVPRLVKDAMLQFPNDEELFQTGIHLLRCLSKDISIETCRQLVTEEHGVLDAAISTFLREEFAAKNRLAACSVLAILCRAGNDVRYQIKSRCMHALAKFFKGAKAEELDDPVWIAAHNLKRFLHGQRALHLQTFAMLPTSFASHSAGGECHECSICMSALAAPSTASSSLAEAQNKKEVCTLPCMHVFHWECVSEWFGADARCPMCKADVKQLCEESESMVVQEVDG
jgi:hypothetical protein